MTDGRVVLAVVILLGVFALGGLAGTVWLIAVGADAAPVAIVSGLTGTALGLVGSLLSSTKSSTPTPVTVTNTAVDPVPTTDTGVAP